MYVVMVSFTAKAGTIDEVLAGLRTIARASITEPGCLEFSVLRDTEDDGAFVLYERYCDEVAFVEGHRLTAHYSEWKSLEARCVISDGRRARTFTPIEEDTIASRAG